MALRLVSEDEEWSIPLQVDLPVCALLDRQRKLADEAGRTALFTELVSRCFLAALKDVLGKDLRLPTETQVGLAVLMARELDIPIPSEALTYRGAMEHFLSTNRQAYSWSWNRREERALDWTSKP